MNVCNVVDKCSKCGRFISDAWLSFNSQFSNLSEQRNVKQNEQDLQNLFSDVHLISRLSILANVQKRLSKMDELRQAAKNGLELRLDKEREELGAKVESRVQKAEANRMLLLRARRQRNTAKEERISQLLTKRLIQEKKYKELVWASIHRKRAAAEKKRLGWLEAEKSRVRTRALQVRQKASAVQSRQEIEKWRLKNQLEAKLQKVWFKISRYLLICYLSFNLMTVLIITRLRG